MDIEVLSIHCAAACRHDSSGAVSGSFNHGIADGDGGSFTIAEYRIGVCAVRCDNHIGEIQRTAVCRKHGRILSVEVGFIPAGFPCLIDGDSGIGTVCAVRKNRMSSVLAVLQCLTDLDIILCNSFRNHFRDFRRQRCG